MFKLSFIYIGSFCLILSLLSFFNIIYSYYFEIFNNIEIYSYTLIISLLLGSLFFLKKKDFRKISLYEKIIAVSLGYLILFQSFILFINCSVIYSLFYYPVKQLKKKDLLKILRLFQLKSKLQRLVIKY